MPGMSFRVRVRVRGLVLGPMGPGASASECPGQKEYDQGRSVQGCVLRNMSFRYQQREF